MTGSHELALLAEERRVVDAEEHAHRRLIDGNRRKRFRIFEISRGVTYFEAVESDHGTDVTATDLLDLGLAQACEYHQILDLLLLLYVIALAQGNVLACLE